ncbi:hypothetical protein TKK_0016076 [Trichogramma kaykai]
MEACFTSEKNWVRIPCIAHTLQLAVKDVSKAMPDLENIRKKCSKIVTHFSHSEPSQKLFEEEQKKFFPDQKPLRLIQRCETRFDTNYLMFERLLMLRGAVDSSCLVLKKKVPKLSDTEWEIIEHYVSTVQLIK